MISSAAVKKRQLVPRWRPLSRAIASQELSSPRDPENKVQPLPNELLKRLGRWREDQNVVTAAELVESAIVHAQESEAVNAARFLLGSRSGARPLVKKQAAILLRRTNNLEDIPKDLVVNQNDTAELWRKRTRLHPSDPMPWVELALAQTSKGHSKHALKSMTVALQLAPHNRHVLRSAARLHLHMHDPQQAHDLIRRNDATSDDPWLIAAEVALASAAERTARFTKKGLAILENDDRHPRQVTELAGALGTTLMEGGNRKRGKRLLQLSMLNPTGNSLAQAEWVAQVYRERVVSEEQLKSSTDRLEAMAMHLFRAGDFAQSLAFARKWIEEEPFSNNAYRAATSAALVDENHAVTEKIANAGLCFNPRSPHLYASLAYAVACMERLDEAEKYLNLASQYNEDDILACVLQADKGLIAMRRGQIDLGRDLYKESIQAFSKKTAFELEIVARAYLAREAARANIEDAPALIAEAVKANAKLKLPNAQRPIDAANELLRNAAMSQVQAAITGKFT